jgi:hypothetical protein
VLYLRFKLLEPDRTANMVMVTKFGEKIGTGFRHNAILHRVRPPPHLAPISPPPLPLTPTIFHSPRLEWAGAHGARHTRAFVMASDVHTIVCILQPQQRSESLKPQ